MESIISIFILALLSVAAPVFGQESVNAHEGINVGFHAGVSMLMCFGILASCAIGVNIMSRTFARYLQQT